MVAGRTEGRLVCRGAAVALERGRRLPAGRAVDVARMLLAAATEAWQSACASLAVVDEAEALGPAGAGLAGFDEGMVRRWAVRCAMAAAIREGSSSPSTWSELAV